MVRIRLTRVGLKKQPSYRIIVNDIEKPRDSRYIEAIGYYNPRTRPATITVQEDRVLYWLSVGAQPSDSVKQLFKTQGTWERFLRYKKGEALEDLLAEAEKAQQEGAEISPKTQYLAPESAKQSLDDAVTAAEEAVETVEEDSAAGEEAETAEE